MSQDTEPNTFQLIEIDYQDSPICSISKTQVAYNFYLCSTKMLALPAFYILYLGQEAMLEAGGCLTVYNGMGGEN